MLLDGCTEVTVIFISNLLGGWIIWFSFLHNIAHTPLLAISIKRYFHLSFSLLGFEQPILILSYYFPEVHFP